MKRNTAFVSIVIGFFMLMVNPVPAQKLEWGLITGPIMTHASNGGYSVVGMVDEMYENEVNPFYSVYLRKKLRKRWAGEVQLGLYGYSYTIKSYYEETQHVQFSKESNKYRFVELFFNNHFILISGKHELSALAGIGLGSVTRSLTTYEQHLENQFVIVNTYNFKEEEDKMQFVYQVGLQYMYSFESFSVLIRPYYKRFTEEQYVIPPKDMSAFGLGVGVQF